MASDFLNSLPMTAPLASAGTAAADMGLPQPATTKDGRTDSGRSFAETLARSSSPGVKAPLKSATPLPFNNPAQKTPFDLKQGPGPRGGNASELTSGLVSKTAGDDDLSAPSPKQNLQALRSVAQNNRQAIDRAPVTLFLTGHLEKLPAAEIPQLVAGNEFLKDALSEEDAATFLSQPTTLRDLVESLELPPAILGEAAALGLDLSQEFAPSDLLKALGIDPQRVLAELTQLKGHLQLDGLAPYLARATALGSKQSPLTDKQASAFDTPLKIPSLQPSPLAVQSDLLAVKWPLAPMQTPIPAVMLTTNDEAAPQLQDLSPQALALALQMQQMPSSVPWVTSPPVESNLAAQPRLAPEVGPRQPGMPGDALLARALDDGTLALVAAAPQSLPSAATPPQAQRATFDAFALLGDQLRASGTALVRESSQTVRTEFVPAGLSLEEQIFSAGLRDASQLNLGSINAPQTPVGPLQRPELMMSQPVALSQMTQVGQVPMKEGLSAMLRQEQGFGFAAALAGEPSRANVAGTGAQANNALAMPLPQVVGATLLVGGEPFKSNDDGPRDEPGGREQLTSLKTPDVWKSLGSDQIKQAPGETFAQRLEAAAGPLPMQARVDLMQKVLGHATMLARQGDGSNMRLDLSSPELGPLQMAIHMDKDQVNLRVLASSDRVRDAVMSDLNQLQGALGAQNVRLGQVEVGSTAPANANNASSGQNGQQFSNQQRQSQFNERPTQSPWTAPVTRLSQPARARIPLAAMQQSYSDGGRIAIRA